MSPRRFHNGDPVILPANKKEGWPEETAVFDSYAGNGMAIVTLDAERTMEDADGIREVECRSIKSVKQIDADRAKQSKQNVRRFKQGHRQFQTSSGQRVFVERIDVKRGVAFVVFKKNAARKNSKIIRLTVALCELFPVVLSVVQ